MTDCIVAMFCGSAAAKWSIEVFEENLTVLQIENDAALNFGRMSRRDWLRVGFLGLGGMTLGELARLQAQGIAETRDTSVLLLFAHGGPRHLETYDLMPDASDDIRGPYGPSQKICNICY